MKILVAEDEPFMSAAISGRLRSEGYDVMVANDGREALRAIEADRPDLIITDIMMPFTSGLELIGIVKSNPNMQIPVIVLSGMGEEATVMEAFQLGADDFLTKPFNPAELSMRVKRALNKIPKKY
ncbi:MAG: response regulator transcription factor [Chitinophagaceae bacterium]|nr:response regulator transcription factor [Chitinophagaceae bacterium]